MIEVKNILTTHKNKFNAYIFIVTFSIFSKLTKRVRVDFHQCDIGDFFGIFLDFVSQRVDTTYTYTI